MLMLLALFSNTLNIQKANATYLHFLKKLKNVEHGARVECGL